MGQKISGSIKSVDVREPPYRPVKRELRGPDFCKPARLDMLLDMPPAKLEVQYKHAWNNEDRSLNIFVKEDDKLTFHRHPVAQSTDCIRGKVGYTRGLHVWQIHWPTRQRGTHAVVGVSTAEAPLHSVGYTSLVGSNSESWGWDLGRNKLYHNCKNQPGVTYPVFLEPDEPFVLPDTLLVVLDMDEGTLSFMVDGQYLGVAFRGLKGKKVYPIVSAVWGHCEITMTYINGLDREESFQNLQVFALILKCPAFKKFVIGRFYTHTSLLVLSAEPLPLMDLCRRSIRFALGRDRLHDIESLPLPQSLKNYLQYQ
ncbi:PREDICTED: SPRY domain-containing SOCS box protein 4 isoform X1 [Gavialis gangeticus]|uniref:SPRY domain-containing SOCS box protein 4 isoform X1 n=1 Tax=Gavialis gangeticus TaxID=94835 RepID=UPI00092EEDC3|nr:PREDICTED: SPRY domain-containing SOCS box protein 4 isoform X1 [Gavialis gangeticus]